MGTPLHARFDIFRLLADGSEQWLAATESFEAAMFHIQLAAAKSPGRYVVQHGATGEKKTINLESKPPVSPRPRKNPYPES